MLVPISSKKYPNLFMQIDEKDYPLISHSKVWASKDDENFYAFIRTCGVKHKVSRLLTSCPVGMKVDHINHNTLDNRRSNLRVVSNADNCANQRKNKGKFGKHTSSIYKGVTKYGVNKWQPQIMKYGKRVYLGYYNTEIEAARAYDNAARLYFGEFACVNFTK